MKNGCFSVKRMNWVLLEQINIRSDIPWKQWRKLNLHQRLLFIGWRLANGGLPTADQLLHRGIIVVVDRACSICSSGDETISHLPLNVILLNVLFLESELQGNWKIFKPAQIVQMASRLVQHSLVNDVKILLPLLLILSKIWQI